jgi:lysophospholipase L1-like esterase
MKSLATALFVLMLGGTALAANDDTSCAVAEHLVYADFPTPRVATAIAGKKLDIVVVGTNSSIIATTGGPAKAYPARLEEALTKRLPGVVVTVTTLANPKYTSVDAEKVLEQVAVEQKPDLVIWQTGTVDAMRAIDLDEFRTALDDGLGALRAANIDAVFINMQFSPRTDQIIAIGSYADAIRLAALQHEVNVFDRFAAMKYWNELGTFDLYAATKKTDIAEGVHYCIARLLSDLIVQAATIAETTKGVN